MRELDVARAPRGVLAAQELVAAVAELGDLAERHYLELKSTLDLSKKKDKEKVAKFILGAANRMPDVAATAFEGYGVMIIGVAQDAISGIPPIEMMEISKVIQKYVGAAGPRWDIVWVPVAGSSNQVLVVLVDPPKFGQRPFPCRATGDSLTDGRIYIRADGETREANADEFDLLIQRGEAGTKVEVDCAVEVIGEVASVVIDEASTVDEYLRKTCARLIDAVPGPRRWPDLASLSGKMMMGPEERSEEEYLESIDHWQSRFRAAWKEALPKIAASQLRPAIVRITNRTTTFLHDVEVRVHLEGEIFAFDHVEPGFADDFSYLQVPQPPPTWGPAPRPVFSAYAAMGHSHPSVAAPRSISYENSGSVDLNLDVGELRPRGSYESEDGAIVLVVTDCSLTSIRGTWELTARDHNEVYTGEIDVAVAERDLTAVGRQILALGAAIE